jgi:primosomal protein DnaI
MSRWVRIGELVGKKPVFSEYAKGLDPEMLENPKAYWEARFPELREADLPQSAYTLSASLRLMNVWYDRKKCEGCTGYHACNKSEDAKGHVFSVGIMEDTIIEQVHSCHYYREHMEKELEKRLWTFSGLNDGHRRMTFENFPKEQKRLNKELCRRAWHFAQNYVPGADMKGLYIYGAYGTAKTHLACAILNQLIARKLRVLYVQAERTFAALSDLYFREHRDGLPTRSEILDKYISADVLVIDELGHENVNDASIWALYTILNGREPQRKPVIITSNFSPMDLAERYLERAAGETSRRAEALISRLYWLTDDYEMCGEDFRSRKYLRNLNEPR